MYKENRMADIYHRELDIPEKSKTIGWVIVSVGIIMILLAIGVSIRTSYQLAKVKQRPWTQTSAQQPITTAPVKTLLPTKRNQLTRAFLLWVLLTLGLLLVFALIAAISHRLANRLRIMTSKKSSKTRYYDAWTESGKRFHLSDKSDDAND